MPSISVDVAAGQPISAAADFVEEPVVSAEATLPLAIAVNVDFEDPCPTSAYIEIFSNPITVDVSVEQPPPVQVDVEIAQPPIHVDVSVPGEHRSVGLGGFTALRDEWVVLVPPSVPELFVLTQAPFTNTEIVMVNGQRIVPGVSEDYTLSGTTLSVAFPLRVDDRLTAQYFSPG